MAGVDVVHMPYRGVAPALTDLLSGRVKLRPAFHRPPGRGVRGRTLLSTLPRVVREVTLRFSAEGVSGGTPVREFGSCCTTRLPNARQLEKRPLRGT
jgi:hypothetical protein